MTNKEYQPAVRAFNRLIGEWKKDNYDSVMADMSYDGGEWSGPAWSDCHEDAEQRYLKLCADSFELDMEKLDNELWNDKYMDHRTGTLNLQDN